MITLVSDDASTRSKVFESACANDDDFCFSGSITEALNCLEYSDAS